MDRAKIHCADGTDRREVKLECGPDTEKDDDCLPERPLVNAQTRIRVLLLKDFLCLLVQGLLLRHRVFDADFFPFFFHKYLPCSYSPSINSLSEVLIIESIPRKRGTEKKNRSLLYIFLT